MKLRRMLVTCAAGAGLLAGEVPAATAGEQVQVKGKDSGSYRLGYELAPSPCRPGELPTTVTASGTMSHVGRYTITASQCGLFRDGTFTVRAGVFTLTTPSGSTLTGTYTGDGLVTATGVSYTNRAAVSAGTGRFVGTTGLLTFRGTATNNPQVFSEVISGSLSH